MSEGIVHKMSDECRKMSVRGICSSDECQREMELPDGIVHKMSVRGNCPSDECQELFTSRELWPREIDTFKIGPPKMRVRDNTYAGL